jgi:hypothetical protein
MIQRSDYLKRIATALKRNPVVGLIGPRQCGKTTLAREYLSADSANYFDLEDPISLARLENPMLALKSLEGLVVIDEIQFKPEVFSILRVLSDRSECNAKFLVLGSASPQLVSAASESLAGRIETIEVTPLNTIETGNENETLLWLRGGFPRSYLASDDEASKTWRKNFIHQFLERDIPRLGIKVSPTNLRRFWMMLAHYHGQIWNGAEIGASLGLTAQTMRSYLDILSETFMIRQLAPWHENLAKRQVKSPRIYFRDSGIFHTLMGIHDYQNLTLNPKLGASWEGFALEEILRLFQPDDIYFWKIHSGPELDLLCFKDSKRIGFEIKYADAPKLTHSMKKAFELLKLDKLYVVHPGKHSYLLAQNIEVITLSELL